ncbi:MAG: bifunctional diguanylate cyclase/phosphodiesterase [Methylococcaceae bacterium]
MNADIAQFSTGPDELEQFRREVMAQMSVLFQNQTRTNVFAQTISSLITRIHTEILREFQENPHDTHDNAIAECQKLDKSLKFLFNEHERQWQKNGEYLKELLKEFNQTINYLSSTLIERDLFERQSHVLEQIVLSHERVTNWKEFIQEILTGFHAIFPFNIFFIAFAEEHGLGLYIYYFGGYNDELKAKVKEKLSYDLFTQLHLSKDALIDIEEYSVAENGSAITLEDIEMITVAVPDHAPKLAGLLGLAYASVHKLSGQERSIIRSLLSVMVMVVGSSKQLSRTLDELEYYSGHDPLTGLYNRRFFTDMLNYEVGRASRHAHCFCILLLDLDNFKDINDSYGHPIGDTTLIKIAQTMREQLRQGDIATRIGGDEFAIILPETELNIEGYKIAECLREKLHAIVFETEEGKSYRVTTSIGLVSFPQDGQYSEALMTAVDVALYHAKHLGKNEVATLSMSKQQVNVAKNSRLYAEELREALSQGRITPYYQPIIDCQTGEVFANEALARMKTPEGVIINAGHFIETIDKYGLTRELDKAILTKALTASRDHKLITGNPARVFLNLSPQEIQERGILSFAEELCTQLALPPSCVVFELLERDAIGDMSHMGRFLSNIRDKGFAFALDDFGSGYNSFHYLRELHFEYVKIDGAFVSNILNSRIDRALVRNLSHLCQDLGILTVAEFVESIETLDMLRDMGINYAQGYAIALPSEKLSFKPFMINT